jgi:hypothetical protein
MELDMRKLWFLVLVAAVLINGCTKGVEEGKGTMSVSKGSFGQTKDGQAVDFYVLKNANGAMA